MDIPEGWDILSLQDIAPIVDCKHRTPEYQEDGVPIISPGNIQWGALRLECCRRVSDHEYESLMDHCTVEIGDIVFGRNQSVGIAAYVTSEERFAIGQDTVLIKPTRIETRHLYAFLQSQEIKKQIYKFLGGSTFGRINLTDLRRLKIIVPPLPEQKKIAEILSAWDHAIEQTEKLITAKQRLKRGLMQQLLTGKRRFPEFVQSAEMQNSRYFDLPVDWKLVRVGNVASGITVRNGTANGLPVLSCTKYDGLVESLKYFGRKVFSDDLSNYKVVRQGQFAYATNHIEEGSIGLLDSVDAGVVSPMYTVFETSSDVYAPYLYLLFKTELYRHIFEVNTNASVDRRGSLRWSQFKRLNIPLPSKSEQEKITMCIKAFQQEIDLLEKQRKALQKQKKGLMQQLLTGKVRVPVANESAEVTS